jgi:uncharacterized protein
MIDFDRIAGFDWDEGNRRKLAKHDVEFLEAEQVFRDDNVMFLKDVKHSEKEQRYQAMGQTKDGRWLHVTFTMRNNDTSIRVISARDMDKIERGCYD